LTIEVVCSSRELFGSDRSALRLAALLRGLGASARLALPASRPERGLQARAAELGLETTVAPVAIASSRGVTGAGALVDPRPRSDAQLTIHNTSAVLRRGGDHLPRVLVLREWLEPDSRRHRALCAWHARRSAAVVAISHAVAERWHAIAGDRIAIEVIPNWIEDEWIREAADQGEREGILFLGRLNAWKGQLALADGFERAFSDSKAAPTLTFAGAEGPDSPFATNAAELRRRCETRGWRLLAFEPDPRALLQRAALVVVPSLRPEPFGNVILEGLASGARVLAFEGGGVDDLAPLFDSALTVVPRGISQLASALTEWAQEGARAQSIEEHRAALATLRERFTAAAAKPRWRAVLDRVS
jgi:glycosyltransferase involved in cell wall biosynthesis